MKLLDKFYRNYSLKWLTIAAYSIPTLLFLLLAYLILFAGFSSIDIKDKPEVAIAAIGLSFGLTQFLFNSIKSWVESRRLIMNDTYDSIREKFLKLQRRITKAIIIEEEDVHALLADITILINDIKADHKHLAVVVFRRLSYSKAVADFAETLNRLKIETDRLRISIEEGKDLNEGIQDKSNSMDIITRFNWHNKIIEIMEDFSLQRDLYLTEMRKSY